MRILFDQGTPVPLRRSLSAHAVSTGHEMGWSALANGDLLDAAEGQFDVFVTADQNPEPFNRRGERPLPVRATVY